MYGFVRPDAARLGVVLGLSVVGTAFGLAQPYLTKWLIDDGLLAGNFRAVVGLSLLIFGAGVLASLVGGINRWHYVTASGRVLFRMREAVYRHLQRLSPAYYADARGGDIMSRLDGDVGELQRFAVDTLLAAFTGILGLVGALVLMISLSWKLSLLGFALLPAEILALRLLRPRVERETRVVRERASDVTAFFFDTLPAMKFIQSVAAEDREAARLSRLNGAYLTNLLRLQIINFATATVPGLLTSLTTVGVFILGGYLVIKGHLTLGVLIAFSAYLARATGPVQTLLGLYVAMQRARVSLHRIAELMREAPAVKAPPHPLPLPTEAAGEIRFEDVSFRYRRHLPAVLAHASFVIPPGTKVGLIGASGAGKTTLIDLLHRHYDPEDGRILLDGVDLRDLDPGVLRRRIAVVAQDTVLFAGSVTDNIRYAAPDASERDVRAAAERAHVDAVVRHLPDGFETEIGERGTALSGGQHQRLAIARALLQDPLVLILDEATSAVDRETEARIIESVDAPFAGRTRIAISHRHDALEGADLIIEITDGRCSVRPAQRVEASHAAAGTRRPA